MESYDRRIVCAPEWMKTFTCTAGACPETCCQQWNIDVDEVHAERYQHLDDPGLQEIMDQTLRSYRLRRPGSRRTETFYRLQLLNRPDSRCPFLNGQGECSLQKKYGASILCDTCYFHPRTFWQIDEQTYLSACLSCPECARLALLHPEPAAFSCFEAEIDPGAEWLETDLITDPGARRLLRDRSEMIRQLCSALQNRDYPLSQRLEHGLDLLKNAEKEYAPGAPALENSPAAQICGLQQLMEAFAGIFDPVPSSIEKPAQGAAVFLHDLAGGTEGYAGLLAENYRRGMEIYQPFIEAHPYLEENFLVHCVFSDSFRQFHHYQDDPAGPAEILRHEANLLTAWYWFFRTVMNLAALRHGMMDEALFLQTVIRADKVWWHYPDWFSRCADRLGAVMGSGGSGLMFLM